MFLRFKKKSIVAIPIILLLIFVVMRWGEATGKRVEKERGKPEIAIPEDSINCVSCHEKLVPGIVEQWEESKHASAGVGCYACHRAEEGDADGFQHFDYFISTVVTPLDCARCHPKEAEEFQKSHHADAGNILDSLDNFLAETVEGARKPFAPFSPSSDKDADQVNGMASSFLGCQQCHGSKMGLLTEDGGMITVDDLKPDADGKPTNTAILDKVVKNAAGKPLFHHSTWPNTGIGRLNLDGSKGSCSACHSRHDFSPRRARRPENCGKCHLGPDHPQKEIYEESKHGIAFRDLKNKMSLDSDKWVLGEDYSQAPTCATCHLSANTRNNREITHDPGKRISWTNRPPVSLLRDTDKDGKVVTETDPGKRAELIVDTAEEKRNRMKAVCGHCHTSDYTDAFYKQYDDFVILYNEKFAKPGIQIMGILKEQGLLTDTPFDEKIKWTWFYLWHHEGRRARHGASMMAPDYAHWHGMFEVSERFYMELIPEAREIAAKAAEEGKAKEAEAVNAVIDNILSRPEHSWFSQDAKEDAKPAQ